MCYKESKDKNTKKKIISSQKSFIKNAIRLHDTRNIIIDAFANKNILPGDLEEDIYSEEKPEYEESIAERTKIKRQSQKGKD